jgi:hypothetical protein
VIRTRDQQRTVGRLQFGRDVGKQLAPRPGLADHVLVAELDLRCVRVRVGVCWRWVGWDGMDGMDGWGVERSGTEHANDHVEDNYAEK